MTRARRLMRWMFGEKRSLASGLPAPDQIHENLRAAVDADEQAMNSSARTYSARVETMIADFFVKYGGRDAHT